MLEVLKKACDLYGQREVGRRIGKSAATVNLVLHSKYPKPQKIIDAINNVFSYLKVDECECPILGVIHIEVCEKYKKWARDSIVKKERLYMQVRAYCNDCKIGGMR